jgi:hypothetical protein
MITMRPLLDIITDEKTLMDEIDIINDAITDPEFDGEIDTLKRRLDALYARLIAIRREIRGYFLRAPR